MKISEKWFKRKWVSYTIATCSAVILFMILSNLEGIFSGFSSLYGFIRPIVTGIVIAYVFNPVAKIFESKVFKKVKKESTKWAISVAFTIIVIVLAVVLLFVALIPQLVDSVATFLSNVGGYVDALQELLREFENDTPSHIFGVDLSAIANFGEKILGTIGTSFSSSVSEVVNTSASIGKSVFDAILAFILAIYLLLDKKKLKSAFSYLMELIMKPESYSNTADFIRRCNDIMIRYISFDIIDGIIVGVVNFIFMLIAGMPYSVLVSFVVGITNLAPTFGPIIGGAIGGFILVLVNPWFGLAFIVFTIILQTFDGYILKPKLFGGSLGVSPLMILISIILGGRLFGVVGILLAIPVSAIIDFTWKDYALKKLEERHAKQYNI
ncbi:MAG: AI-2E family transporter [Butyrivibrio sp.]|nr:AI-2E family transporter [Butyrivibrio sp.]